MRETVSKVKPEHSEREKAKGSFWKEVKGIEDMVDDWLWRLFTELCSDLRENYKGNWRDNRIEQILQAHERHHCRRGLTWALAFNRGIGQVKHHPCKVTGRGSYILTSLFTYSDFQMVASNDKIQIKKIRNKRWWFLNYGKVSLLRQVTMQKGREWIWRSKWWLRSKGSFCVP